MIRDKRNQELLVETLKKAGLFIFFNNSDIERLYKSTINVLAFKNGDFIIKEGVTGGMFFMLAEGVVSVYKKDENGKKVVIRVMHQGDFFGEIALITGSARTSSIIAESEVKVFSIGKEDFFSIFMSNPKVKSVLEFESHSRKANVVKKIKAKSTQMEVSKKI